MTTIALLGAGGKMGRRISDNLKKTDYRVRHVEISERGREALAERGISTVPLDEALEGAEVVILALPDNRIGAVTHQIESLIKPGTMLIALDIAAPLAGALPQRDDLIYFVTHPVTPPFSALSRTSKRSATSLEAFGPGKTLCARWCKARKKPMRWARPLRAPFMLRSSGLIGVQRSRWLFWNLRYRRLSWAHVLQSSARHWMKPFGEACPSRRRGIS